ncbi:MAG: CRISPR-associated helicase/endonuclease Cas3, partial [Clostridia bacterium]|nr:CRISPR-associated helicase/endonuclease Cas3 [Clostridia bacterium]
AAELSERRQVLCVVNTRKLAQEVFALLPPEGSYHLSTLMDPAHRKQVLAEIRKRLREGMLCRVVSTSLIEAGVDIDFPEVFREKTGLDSIIQAAGRCNREGKRSVSEIVVTVFRTEGKAPPMISVSIGATNETIKVFDNEIGSPATIDAYFKSYRDLIGKENIDKTKAVDYLTRGNSGCRLPFETVATAFHLIDTVTRTVYIPNEQILPLIDAIRGGYATRGTYRKAGSFGVDVYESHFNVLLLAGDIEELPGGSAVLLNGDVYDEQTGLSLKADFGKAEYI